MVATVPQLGARVLRKLGLAIVAGADRPGAGAVPGAVVTADDIAANALRNLGVNPDDVGDYATAATVDQTTLATRVLIRRGVIAADTVGSGFDLDLASSKVEAVHDFLAGLGYVAWPLSAVPVAAAEHYIGMTAHVIAGDFGRPGAPEDYKAALDALRLLSLSGARGQRLALAKVQVVHAEMVGVGLASWGLDAIPLAMSDAYAMMTATLLAPEFGREADPKMYAGNVGRIRQLVMSGPVGQALAEQKIRAVHATLDARGKVRWTLYDLPDFAEEPYVQMAAVLLAPEADAKADPSWWSQGEAALARVVSIPSAHRPVIACYF